MFLDITEALGGMQAVAEHMNEMQKIYDEFGNTFDEMSRDCRLVTGKHRVVRKKLNEKRIFIEQEIN